MSTADAFPRLDAAPDPSRLSRAERIDAEGALPLLPATAEGGALPLRMVVGADTVVVAVASLHPKTITLAEDIVLKYLDAELGMWPELLERHRRLGVWRERYTKNAKTIVRLGKASDRAQLATRPHGLAYELVPSSDPTQRQPGALLEVRGYADGQPVRAPFAPLRIGLVEADGSASWEVADPRGCVRLAPSTRDGWLIRSILIRPLESPEANWDSHFAALTVGIATVDASPTEQESSP